MKSLVYSAHLEGIHATLIEIETTISPSNGRTVLQIIGLNPHSIPGTRQRVLMAIKSYGLDLDKHSVFVNVAPASLKKEGSLFDLPIAFGVLQALDVIKADERFIDNSIVVGELSIHGDIKRIDGSLVLATETKTLHKKRIIVPEANKEEAALVDNIEVIGAKSLTHFVEYIQNHNLIRPTKNLLKTIKESHISALSLDDIKGQSMAKRALQIAAAGRHNILLFGSPGSGKTMLAQRLGSIMPPMSYEEIIETTMIYSVSGKLNDKSLILDRPFRNPHHSISRSSLIGGGIKPMPGEISLAHHGVLFLDEFAEFRREALEGLREPMENGVVNISRTLKSIQYPSNFLLVAAFNPCPCGFYGDDKKECRCSPSMVATYRSKLSGPLLDRIDLHIGIKSVSFDQAMSTRSALVGKNAEDIKKEVMLAKTIQSQRFNSNIKTNSMMTAKDIENYCQIDDHCKDVIKKFFDKYNLTMRSFHKVLKIARTIADLSQSENISLDHLKEALMYKFDEA